MDGGAQPQGAFGDQPGQGQHHLVDGQQRADPEGEREQQQGARRGEAGDQFFLDQQAEQAAGSLGPVADPGDEAVGGDRDQARGGGGHDRQAHGPQRQLVDRSAAEGEHQRGADAEHHDPHARADDQIGLGGDGRPQGSHPVVGRGVGDAHQVAGGVGRVVAEQGRGDQQPRHTGDGETDLSQGGETFGLLLLGELGGFFLAGGHGKHLRRGAWAFSIRGARTHRAQPVDIGATWARPSKIRVHAGPDNRTPGRRPVRALGCGQPRAFRAFRRRGADQES